MRVFGGFEARIELKPNPAPERIFARGGINWFVIVLGLILAIVAWGFSLVLSERVQEEYE